MNGKISFALYTAATLTLLTCLVGMPLGWFGDVPVWASVLATMVASVIVLAIIGYVGLLAFMFVCFWADIDIDPFRGYNRLYNRLICSRCRFKVIDKVYHWLNRPRKIGQNAEEALWLVGFVLTEITLVGLSLGLFGPVPLWFSVVTGVPAAVVLAAVVIMVVLIAVVLGLLVKLVIDIIFDW